MYAPEFEFHKSLSQRLQQVYNETAEHVLKGKPKSFDAYQFQLGVLEGYRNALKIALDTERELMGKPPLK